MPNFLSTTTKVENVSDINEQSFIVDQIHYRAHKNALNNYHEAVRSYFWPKMKNDSE